MTPVATSGGRAGGKKFPRLELVVEVDDMLVALAPRGRALFEVSPVYRRFLAGAATEDEAREIERDLARLSGLGYLVAPGAVAPTPTPFYLALNLVHGCNLACTYCNVKQGTFGDAFQLMSFETAKRAIDRFATRERPTELTFFGGEPLMNWPVIVACLEHLARVEDREIRTSIVTNGTLLDEERARVLARHGVIVTISIDGDRDEHDKNRRFVSGEGSYDAVARGVGALVASGAKGVLHAVHDGAGKNFQARWDHLRELGGRRLSVVLGPEATSGSPHAGFGDESLGWGGRLRATWRTGDHTLPGYVAQVVSMIASGERAQVHEDCPAGSSGVTITPAGDVFACHVSAARKINRLGNLADAELPNKNPLGCAPRPKKCSSCWADGLCSHGCPIHRSMGIDPSEEECTFLREPYRLAGYWLSRARFEDIAPLWQLDDAERRSLARAWAVREAVRAANRHVKPLAIYPTPA